MTQTQAHGRKVLRIQTVEQRGQLGANAVEELSHLGGDDLNAELLLDGLACGSRFKTDAQRRQ